MAHCLNVDFFIIDILFSKQQQQQQQQHGGHQEEDAGHEGGEGQRLRQVQHHQPNTTTISRLFRVKNPRQNAPFAPFA